METLYTPGPWNLNIIGGMISSTDYLIEGVCTLQTKNHNNARLIAAAPELLEACKNVLEHAERGGLTSNSSSLDLVKQAIAKAER